MIGSPGSRVDYPAGNGAGPADRLSSIMTRQGRSIGDHLRDWRLRRRRSQLDLALDAGISSRHLSFLETGRARPSREMVLRLAERLDVPLRQRNALLLAAGYAPTFPERDLDDPALAPARTAVDAILAVHDPFPALAVDRGWSLLAANRAVGWLLAGVPDAMLQPPVNVLRLSLHPDGLASRIANLPEWRAHILARLRGQVELTADEGLATLLDELSGYPGPAGDRGPRFPDRFGGIAVPLQLVTDDGLLAFLGTTTVFGTPVDVTLSELAIEAFYPADAVTAERLRVMAARAG